MGFIIGIFVVILAIFFLIRYMIKVSEKERTRIEQSDKFLEDTLNAHPELGNYKRYNGGAGIILFLSENGYVAYLKEGVFTSKKIENVKSIKFIAEPFDKNIIGAAGIIKYRIEVTDDFANPLVDLPFGVYRDVPDRNRQEADFSEVKASFNVLKRMPE